MRELDKFSGKAIHRDDKKTTYLLLSLGATFANTTSSELFSEYLLITSFDNGANIVLLGSDNYDTYELIVNIKEERKMLDRPIICIDREELDEAIEFLSLKTSFVSINTTKYFPYMLYADTEKGQIFASWNNYETIKDVQKSVLWLDIREQCKPKLKEWYELPENIGKLCWTWNDGAYKVPGVFKRYDKKNNKYPFKCRNGKFANVELINPEALAKDTK